MFTTLSQVYCRLTLSKDARAETIGVTYSSAHQQPSLRPDLPGYYIYTLLENARFMKADAPALIQLPHLSSTHIHAPPEVKNGAFVDPFAVDVYMVGRLLFAWLSVRDSQAWVYISWSRELTLFLREW